MTESGRVAAAVCYREQGGDVQFLLVRTKGGDKWTFPKGHVEPGEDPRDAALREAREEAGVTGEIDPYPFAEYDYPETRAGEGADRIRAYLLKVTAETPGQATESWRRPSWFEYDAALDRLADGAREERYVAEHARVLAAALAAVEQRPRER